MEIVEIVKVAAIIIGAYLLGSIPWGFIIGKMHGIDIRTVGSKNIGATNVTRCVGKWSGKLCFLLDFLKGMLPVLAAQFIPLAIPEHQKVYVVIAALFATVFGHMFPVFLKFKGGKDAFGNPLESMTGTVNVFLYGISGKGNSIKLRIPSPKPNGQVSIPLTRLFKEKLPFHQVGGMAFQYFGKAFAGFHVEEPQIIY